MKIDHKQKYELLKKENAQLLEQLIKLALKKNKTTILFVTHHLEPLKNSITKIFTINQVLE